jgi:hypothetical protein
MDEEIIIPKLRPGIKVMARVEYEYDWYPSPLAGAPRVPCLEK